MGLVLATCALDCLHNYEIKNKSKTKNKNKITLAGVAWVVGASSCNRKGAGSTSSLGAYGRQPIHASRLHSCFSLSLPLSLKAMKKCPQVRIRRKTKNSYFIPSFGLSCPLHSSHILTQYMLHSKFFLEPLQYERKGTVFQAYYPIIPPNHA